MSRGQYSNVHRYVYSIPLSVWIISIRMVNKSIVYNLYKTFGFKFNVVQSLMACLSALRITYHTLQSLSTYGTITQWMKHGHAVQFNLTHSFNQGWMDLSYWLQKCLIEEHELWGRHLKGISVSEQSSLNQFLQIAGTSLFAQVCFLKPAAVLSLQK